jgi:hypothetical protein
MEDKWKAKLPDGREVKYRIKEMLSGRFKISARETSKNLDHSRIVEYPVERNDVETVFLSDLM